MSVQFGRWNFDGAAATPDCLDKVRVLFAPYGPDGEGSYCHGGMDLVYRAFHTTKESARERQPCISLSGAVLTWDGRLDNREDLVRELSGICLDDTDVSIVAAAYDQWKTECFARLIGDWAVSVWNPNERMLLLAKDFVGTRHLYYSVETDQVSWSSILDPLVLLAHRTFPLNEEYLAGWFSSFPAAHLTPYVGVHAVPPACFVALTPRRHAIIRYWEFDGAKRIRYRSDTQYEEHFRTVFAESVRRRLRSNAPILAELSGGMDSSSIVCMADKLTSEGFAGGSRINTVSYFSKDEPNWNERPYFSKVEERRGQVGLHIDAGSQPSLGFGYEGDRAILLPGSGRSSRTELADWIRSQGHRVVLSGIGGDEVTGGVPTPVPELEDLLARARLKALARQLKAWALKQRRPWIHLALETASGFMPPWLVGLPKHARSGVWLRPEFVRRNTAAFLSYERRRKLFGALPSFQENLAALDAMRRQLACVGLQAETPVEKRYPFLDRSLLEFLYAVPREQLVRPGQRRSLMRRALIGIVPEEVLNRSRKGYVSRSPIAAISTEYPRLIEMCGDMASGSLGFVRPELFRTALEDVRLGRAAPSVSLMRTLGIECWLESLRSHGILDGKTAVFSRLQACERDRTMIVASS